MNTNLEIFKNTTLATLVKQCEELVPRQVDTQITRHELHGIIKDQADFGELKGYIKVSDGSGGHWKFVCLARNKDESEVYSLNQFVHNNLVDSGFIKLDSDINYCMQAFDRGAAYEKLRAALVLMSNIIDTKRFT